MTVGFFFMSYTNLILMQWEHNTLRPAMDGPNLGSTFILCSIMFTKIQVFLDKAVYLLKIARWYEKKNYERSIFIKHTILVLRHILYQSLISVTQIQ